jgi:hypothetical protein
LHGAFVWARRALNDRFRRFPARAEEGKKRWCADCSKLHDGATSLRKNANPAMRAGKVAKCKIKGCEAPRVCKQLCRPHYRKLVRSQLPLLLHNAAGSTGFTQRLCPCVLTPNFARAQWSANSNAAFAMLNPQERHRRHNLNPLEEQKLDADELQSSLLREYVGRIPPDRKPAVEQPAKRTRNGRAQAVRVPACECLRCKHSY